MRGNPNRATEFGGFLMEVMLNYDYVKTVAGVSAYLLPQRFSASINQRVPPS
jgi:hypothetical protein